MEAKAKLSKMSISPRKARLILDLIRNKNIDEAVSILKNCSKLGAESILKLLNSASANAVNTKGMKANLLFVKEVMAGDGPTLKRVHPRARGRSNQILKRSSHIWITLAERKQSK